MTDGFCMDSISVLKAKRSHHIRTTIGSPIFGDGGGITPENSPR